MANLNKVMIIGNLTKDPESRAVGQTVVANLSIAANRRWKGGDGTQKEQVSYFDCEAWGKTADVVMQYLKKGRTVLVEGRLQQDRWEQEGQKRSRVKIVVENLQFLDAKIEGVAVEQSVPSESGIGDPDVAF